MVVRGSIHDHITTIYYKTKTTKIKIKATKKKSQKHKKIHNNVQYSEIYKSLHSILTKKHTNSNTISLII